MESRRKASGSAKRQEFAPLLGATEVANWLGVSSSWVREQATKKAPRLRSVRVGKMLRFDSADVQDFIRQCSANAGTDVSPAHEVGGAH